MSQINSTTLRTIANESPESQTIFKALQERKRTRKVTDLRQFQYKLLDKGAKLTKEDVMHTFKKLEDAGIGSIIIGRRGKPTRFKWNYSIKRVAIAAKTKPKNFSNKMEIAALREKISKTVPREVRLQKVSAVISTSIKVREGVVVKMEIPFDLTKKDADMLTKIIYELVDKDSKPKPEESPNNESVNKNHLRDVSKSHQKETEETPIDSIPKGLTRG